MGAVDSESRQVLTAVELRRIQQMAFGSEPHNQQKRNDKEELLKSRSAKHISTWAQNDQKVIKKLAQKEIREQEQKRIDEEDLARHVAERKAMVDRAEREKYNNTDEVKATLAGMMLSDVIRENQHNQQLKKHREVKEKKRMEEFLERRNRTIKAEIEGEQANLAARKLYDQQLVQIQKEQFREYMQAKEERVRQSMEEGRQIAQRQERDRVEAIKKAQERVQYIKEQKLQWLAENINLKEIRDREKDKVKEELTRIAAYAEDKRMKEQMRKDVADQRLRKRLAVKQKMIDIQSEALRNRINNEDEIVAAQIKTSEMKAEMRLQKERTNQLAQKKMLDDCRQRQIMELQVRKAEERRIAKELQEKWTREKRAFDDESVEQKRRERERALELAKFHQQQMDDKRNREQLQRDELHQFTTNAVKEHELFVNELKRVAEATIDEYTKEQRNTLPIKIAISKNRSLCPSRQIAFAQEDYDDDDYDDFNGYD